MNVLKFEIEWSENWLVDNMPKKGVSFAFMNALLGMIDMKKHSLCRGYNKTSFKISGTIDGEPVEYEGRYDLGDGHRSVIEHIRLLNTNRAKNPNLFGAALAEEVKKSSEFVLEKLIPALVAQNEFAPNEEKMLKAIEDCFEEAYSFEDGEKRAMFAIKVFVGEEITIQEALGYEDIDDILAIVSSQEENLENPQTVIKGDSLLIIDPVFGTNCSREEWFHCRIEYLYVKHFIKKYTNHRLSFWDRLNLLHDEAVYHVQNKEQWLTDLGISA